MLLDTPLRLVKNAVRVQAGKGKVPEQIDHKTVVTDYFTTAGEWHDLLLALEEPLGVIGNTEDWNALRASGAVTVGMVVDFLDESEASTPELAIRRSVQQALIRSTTARANFRDPSEIPIGYALRFTDREWMDLLPVLNLSLGIDMPRDEWITAFCSSTIPPLLERVLTFCKGRVPHLNGFDTQMSELEQLTAAH